MKETCKLFSKVQNSTSKDILAKIYAARCFTDTTPSDVEDSIKDIRVTIVKPDPEIRNQKSDISFMFCIKLYCVE